MTITSNVSASTSSASLPAAPACSAARARCSRATGAHRRRARSGRRRAARPRSSPDRSSPRRRRARRRRAAALAFVLPERSSAWSCAMRATSGADVIARASAPAHSAGARQRGGGGHRMLGGAGIAPQRELGAQLGEPAIEARDARGPRLRLARRGAPELPRGRPVVDDLRRRRSRRAGERQLVRPHAIDEAARRSHRPRCASITAAAARSRRRERCRGDRRDPPAPVRERAAQLAEQLVHRRIAIVGIDR